MLQQLVERHKAWTTGLDLAVSSHSQSHNAGSRRVVKYLMASAPSLCNFQQITAIKDKSVSQKINIYSKSKGTD